MEYRAVGNRCAIILDSLNLPISHEETLAILKKKGFGVLAVDMLSLARHCVGVSRYRRGARLYEAPSVVDCSSLVKWLYGERGIWLPRRSIQQRELGESVDLGELVLGDIVFVSGWIDYYDQNPSDGVGHVGVATGEGSIIHAANSKINIIEGPVAEFIGKNKFRGARRYISRGAEVITLETPPNREVEIADDIRWIVLQSLGKARENP